MHIFFHQTKKDKFYFFFFIILLVIILVLPNNSIYGDPFLLLLIEISLKEIPLLIPVPKALVKASFAANRFE